MENRLKTKNTHETFCGDRLFLDSGQLVGIVGCSGIRYAYPGCVDHGASICLWCHDEYIGLVYKAHGDDEVVTIDSVGNTETIGHIGPKGGDWRGDDIDWSIAELAVWGYLSLGGDTLDWPEWALN